MDTKNIELRSSFWKSDLEMLKNAQKSSNYTSLLRSKTKEYQNHPEFLIGLIEIAGTQIFFWQLPDCLLKNPDYLQKAVKIDSKVLTFIPKEKVDEPLLLETVNGKPHTLENLFLIPHVAEKLTFSVCHLALKTKPSLCMTSYFKSEPKLTLSREERQVLYVQLTQAFKSIQAPLPPYLEKFDGIATNLGEDGLNKLVNVLQMQKKLTIALPKKEEEPQKAHKLKI